MKTKRYVGEVVGCAICLAVIVVLICLAASGLSARPMPQIGIFTKTPTNTPKPTKTPFPATPTPWWASPTPSPALTPTSSPTPTQAPPTLTPTAPPASQLRVLGVEDPLNVTTECSDGYLCWRATGQPVVVNLYYADGTSRCYKILAATTR